MRRLFGLFASILLVLPLVAQDIKFPASLDRLKDKASEVVDVTLDASMLTLASRFLSDRGDQAKAKKLVSQLKGIYVRSYEFDRDGEWQQSDLESVRAQLKTTPWSRIVGVTSQKKGENSEVYVKTENGQITGLTVLVAEPRELTIVNIVGPIDPEQIADLGGHMGIPRLGRKSGWKD